MSKKDEALKLALEALEDISSHYMSLPKKGCMALAAIEEALAEQETVLPGGGHVPAVPVAVYGYCPECGGAGVMRERRPNGDDKCTNGHKYPSSKALAEQPAPVAEPHKQPEPCQCPECQVTPHASDCAVHNEPAYPNGACNCRAQPVQEPVAYDKTELNCFAQDLYDKKMREGKHGHYESMFHVIHQCIKKVAPPASKPLTDEEIDNLPWGPHEGNPMTFAEGLRDFARAIEAKLREKNA